MNSAVASDREQATRLILFEIGGGLYAFPIDDVLEVLEAKAIAPIPTLPISVGGVINLHGEALPTIAAGALFENAVAGAAEHLLVLAGMGGEFGQLALPVDRVLALSNAVLGSQKSSGWIRERITLSERIVAVLDAEHTLARAEACFRQSIQNGATPGRETG